MSEITWAILNAETSYYKHNQYLLLKRRIKGYFVFSVWTNNRMMCITYNEYEFLEIAGKVIIGEAVIWKNCD